MLIGDAALMCGHMLGVRRYLDRCMCWQQNAVTQAGRRRCVCAVFPWPISIDLGDNLLFSFDWARSLTFVSFFFGSWDRSPSDFNPRVAHGHARLFESELFVSSQTGSFRTSCPLVWL